MAAVSAVEMEALLTLLQSADGYEIEPNVDSKGDWVFTDLGFGISIALLLQSLMLLIFFKCVTRHFQVYWGLEPGHKGCHDCREGSAV